MPEAGIDLRHSLGRGSRRDGREVLPRKHFHCETTGVRTVCVALPGRVLEVIDPISRLARVDVLGSSRVINLSLLDAAAPGDWVLVHTGFALERVTEAEAAEIVRLFAEIESSLPPGTEEEEAAL